MKISFTDFWEPFDSNSNFFIDLIKTIDNTIQVIPLSNDTDVLIYSCFGTRHHTVDRGRTKKIFYTGESLRPNFNECDYSWTFDFNNYSGKNIRVPLWLLQIDFFNKNNYLNPQYVVPLLYLTNQNINPWFSKSRNNFCVIVNNHLPNQRDVLINSLSKTKKVVGYGKPFGNSWFYGEENKLNIISDFKFNICFENKLYPGYYTEKLLHAKAAGCIPLYYADSHVNVDFNTKAFLNLSDFTSMEEYVEYIHKIDQTPLLAEEIRHQKLFSDSNYPLNLLLEIKDKIKKQLF